MANGLLMYFDIDTGYYPGLHHGLAYLMGSVNKKNDVNFFHIYKEEQLHEVKDLIEGKNWDFVGVSFTTNQRKFLWKLAEITNLNNIFLIGKSQKI